MAKRFVVIIAGLFLLAVFAVLSTSCSTEDKPAHAVSVREEQHLPADEREFISTVSNFRSRYRQAANEFQKSNLRAERSAALAKVLPSLSVSDWIGEVSQMVTTSGDRWGALSVVIGSDKSITVTTRLTNLLDNRTMIPPGSELYNRVAQLTIGNSLTFSGTFEQGTSEYATEVSLTEESSMTEPAFLFTFTSVGSGVVPPKTPSVWIRREVEPKAEPAQPPPPPEPIAPVAPVVPSEPAPAPPVPTATTSGMLCNGPVQVPKGGELTFRNLPGDRLRFTFDHDAWLPLIRREPDGTRTLIMRSIKPGIQTKCDIRWEVVQ